MEDIKQKAIELLLDIISKEDFEMILYEKVKREDLLKNKLLFELVNINYRKEYCREKVVDIYKNNLDEEIYTIYKVISYCSKINSSEKNVDIIKWFERAVSLFSFEQDCGLMWNFVELSDRLGFIYMKYEKEEDIIEDIKHLSVNITEAFKKTTSIKEKCKLLEDGIDIKYKLKKKWYQFWK